MSLYMYCYVMNLHTLLHCYIALQLSRQEVSNGVIALNSSVSFKEIAFSLVSGTTVITKLYLSGEPTYKIVYDVHLLTLNFLVH